MSTMEIDPRVLTRAVILNEDVLDEKVREALPIDLIDQFESMLHVGWTEVAGTGTSPAWCEATVSVCQTNCGCGTTICVTQDPCIGDSVTYCGC